MASTILITSSGVRTMHPANTWVPRALSMLEHMSLRPWCSTSLTICSACKSGLSSTFEGTLQLRGFLRKTIFHPLFPPSSTNFFATHRRGSANKSYQIRDQLIKFEECESIFIAFHCGTGSTPICLCPCAIQHNDLKFTIVHVYYLLHPPNIIQIGRPRVLVVTARATRLQKRGEHRYHKYTNPPQLHILLYDCCTHTSTCTLLHL